jgi:Domain of unknown function (DUF4062)
MTRRRYDVFVSSTYEDLKTERRHLREVLLDQSHYPLRMDAFEGGARPPWHKIREAIDDCDYYILMVAGRYGSVDPSDPAGFSYTEKEYRFARQRKKPMIVFMLSDAAVAKLPPKKAETTKKAKDRLKAFRARLRRDGFVNIVDRMPQFKEAIQRAVPRWLMERPQDAGWVRAAELNKILLELKKASAELERERSHKDVYTYLFDRLNPYENVLTRAVLRGLDSQPLSSIPRVTYVLEQLIYYYVNDVIDAHIRVYFAYSLTEAHLTQEWAVARTEDPAKAIYRFAISNSKSGPWMEGAFVEGPSNLHNVYRKCEILGIKDSRQVSYDPETMNQPMADEGSVIAAPVVYGRNRYPIGVVGLNSPKRDEALDYRGFVRELAILFSSLFYAYGQSSGENVDEEKMARTIRGELIEVYGPKPQPPVRDEVRIDDLLNEIPARQRMAFRESISTHLVDQVPAAVPVAWLTTLFYYDAPQGLRQKLVKVQIIAFSSEASGHTFQRETLTEVRGRAVGSLGGGAPAPNKRAYLIRPLTDESSTQSENDRGLYELQISPGDLLVFAVGYDNSIAEMLLSTPEGPAKRDWICVEAEDLAAQGPIDYFFATSGAGQAVSFHSECEFFMDGTRMRFDRVLNCSGVMADLPAAIRDCARQASVLAQQDLPEFASVFADFGTALASSEGWNVDYRRAQRHDVAYVLQFSEARQSLSVALADQPLNTLLRV